MSIVFRIPTPNRSDFPNRFGKVSKMEQVWEEVVVFKPADFIVLTE